MLYHQIGAYQVPSQGSYLISLSLFSHLQRLILFGLRTVLPQHWTKCRCPVCGGLVLGKVEWLEAQNVEDTTSEPLPDVLVIDYVVMPSLDLYWSFLHVNSKLFSVPGVRFFLRVWEEGHSFQHERLGLANRHLRQWKLCDIPDSCFSAASKAKRLFSHSNGADCPADSSASLPGPSFLFLWSDWIVVALAFYHKPPL